MALFIAEMFPGAIYHKAGIAGRVTHSELGIALLAPDLGQLNRDEGSSLAERAANQAEGLLPAVYLEQVNAPIFPGYLCQRTAVLQRCHRLGVSENGGFIIAQWLLAGHHPAIGQAVMMRVRIIRIWCRWQMQQPGAGG